jgi:uncharacterized protein (DUF1501 family)
MDFKEKISRREFLVQSNCAAVGTASLISSLLSLKLTAGAVSASNYSDYKVLVCLFLNGGNDSFNMLVPRDVSAYEEYKNVRGGTYLADGINYDSSNLENLMNGSTGLAHQRNHLLPITSVGQSYSEFGIHPDLPFLQTLYDQGDLAFVSNVGSLIQPTSLSDYNNGIKLPEGLFSHPDHQIHWQTLVPQVRGSNPKGWAGRMSEVISHANTQSNILMNISLSGSNVLQTGLSTVPYIADPSGIVELKNYSEDPTLKLSVDNILSQHYHNIYSKTLAQSKKKSIETSIYFKEALDSLTVPYDPSIVENYSKTASRFSMLSKIIEAVKYGALGGMNRQTFFVELNGWDHHNEVVVPQSNLFYEINEAIEMFWQNIVNLGLENNVVLYTASDFGRTLTSNGRGSDHAWGGNHFIISGSANGGQIYGDYPILSTGGPNDLGRGRILPTTSVDAYMAELAGWFGVPQSEISTVIPNINNFNFGNILSPLGILY